MKPLVSITPTRQLVEIKQRKRIALAVRYEVLKGQCDPEIVERAESEGGKLKDRYSKLLRYARCAMSGEELIVYGCEYDHIIPLALGGSNEADNIQALTPKAHRRKTDADDAAIAKARHRALETGQQAERKRRGGSSIQSRGFDKTLRKKMNGEVVPRQGYKGKE